MIPKTGNIYLADLPMDGHVQSGKRPVIVYQNSKGNKHSPNVHIVPLSKQIHKASHLPTHVVVTPNQSNGLASVSVALAEDLRPISKDRLLGHIGELEENEYRQVAEAIRLHLAI